MALNGVVFADELMPAGLHYRAFPWEPLQAPGNVLDIAEIRPLVTIMDLLQSIARGSMKNVLVACHAAIGQHGATGLKIPVVHGGRSTYFEDGVFDLLGPGDHGGFQEQEVAKQLKLPAADLKSMQALAETVRKRNLDRLVLRGCELGIAPAVLMQIKKVFGCTYLEAPIPPVFFDSLPTSPHHGTGLDQARANWLANPRRSHATAENGVYWVVIPEIKNKYKVELQLFADSAAALASWVSHHFGEGRFSPGQELHWEAIRAGDALVFPNDPQYRNWLVAI
jgi:hypothetical protein